jgi:N-acetyl-alpha-D-glucosaminyl L-malate synthase BshA
MPARLLFVGDGPERVRAQQLAEELGLGERVLFLGKQSSVAELLSCSDLFVLPSEHEAFGLVALEAMACGVPVIATRVGGIPEVVTDGASGYLAEVGDVATMAEQGIALLADDARWNEASAAARADAERYGAERVVPLYEACYEEVLAR